MVPKLQQDGTWMYPPIGVVLVMVGLEDIGIYISCKQNTVTQYIATHPIMDLCLVSDRKPRMHLSRQWWEHPALDIMWIRAGQAASEGG